MARGRELSPEARAEVKSIMDALRTAREQAGLSQKELAGRIDYSQGSVSDMENGLIMPFISTVVAYAEEVGLSLRAVRLHNE